LGIAKGIPPQIQKQKMARKQTPWGVTQDFENIADGIIFYSTARHGGYWLSKKRLAEMPDALKIVDTFIPGNQWYEEDLDWCLVVIAFPQFFTKDYNGNITDEVLNHAWATLKNWIPEVYETLTKQTLKPGESYMKDKKAYWQKGAS